MFELVKPRAELFGAWAEAHQEWGPGLHEDGFGIGSNDDVDTVEGFRDWITRIEQDSGELWWIVEDGEVLGGIALRAADDDDRVHRFGHIGYGVRPSARGRGVATWALGEVLRHAAAVGIDPVLAFCLDNNGVDRDTRTPRGDARSGRAARDGAGAALHDPPLSASR